MEKIPAEFDSEEHLDDFMSTPSPALVEMMGRLEGDLMVLGIGGKMGHTLGRQAVRAIREAGVSKRVIGVSRFTDGAVRQKIERDGVEAHACDLLDPEEVAGLPTAPNIVFMAGRKFGTSGSEHLTWAMNAVVPHIVSERFTGANVVAFSTGCVYPLVEIDDGGCTENDPADPVGEYAMSCLARERIFEHFSVSAGTRTAIARLNYAIDMRYGVLHDIASSVWRDGTADITVPAFNAIWQGDATDQILRTLEYCRTPPFVINITGPEQVSTRGIADEFGRVMDCEVRFSGIEGKLALLSDSGKARRLFGTPSVSMETMTRWTAAWVASGGKSIGKPTHFEVSDGKF
jgi:nucleoside-diphosphate-sugar epimerase